MSEYYEEYEVGDSYMSGFDDAKQKALDLIHKHIYGPFKPEQQEYARKIYRDIEENM